MCPTVALDKHITLGLKRLGYSYDNFSGAVNYIVGKYCKEKLQCADGIHCSEGDEKNNKMGGGIKSYVREMTGAGEPLPTEDLKEEEAVEESKRPDIDNIPKGIEVAKNSEITEEVKDIMSKEEPQKRYFCSVCERFHSRASKWGVQHECYEVKPPEKVEDKPSVKPQNGLTEEPTNDSEEPTKLNGKVEDKQPINNKEESKDHGYFYCSKCECNHRYSNPKTRDHIKYASEPSEDVKIRKAKHDLRMRITKLRKRPEANHDRILELENKLAELDKTDNNNNTEKPAEVSKKLEDKEVTVEPEHKTREESFNMFFKGYLK
jgi:hypothetical protein